GRLAALLRRPRGRSAARPRCSILVALVGDIALAVLALEDLEKARSREERGKVLHAVVAGIDGRLPLRRAARRRHERPAVLARGCLDGTAQDRHELGVVCPGIIGSLALFRLGLRLCFGLGAWIWSRSLSRWLRRTLQPL